MENQPSVEPALLKSVDLKQVLDSIEEERSTCVLCKTNKRPKFSGINSPRFSEIYSSEYICPDCSKELREQELYDHAYILVDQCGGDLVLIVKELLRMIKGSTSVLNSRRNDVIYGKRK